VSRPRKIFLALSAACLAAIGGVGLSAASFTSRSVSGVNTFTAATSFCTSAGLQSVTANRDSWVDQNNATTNSGNDQTMIVRSRSGSRNGRVVVGFTMPAKPSGCSVTLATLKLNASSATTGRTIGASQISPSASWTETGVNWNNQPSFTGTAATAASGTGLRSWTVTSQVQAMYGSAAPNNGFLLKDQTEDAGGAGAAQTYSTREATSNKPTLEVTFG
jgi:hypothetical protein